MSGCTGCNLKYIAIIKDFFVNSEKTIMFLIVHEVLPKNINCDKCGIEYSKCGTAPHMNTYYNHPRVWWPVFKHPFLKNEYWTFPMVGIIQTFFTLYDCDFFFII
jgi:hypothetical protein